MAKPTRNGHALCSVGGGFAVLLCLSAGLPTLLAQAKTYRDIPLDIAKELAAHEAWVRSEGASGHLGDFADDNLRNLNLAKKRLSGAILWGADLSGANLADAELKNAILADAELADVYAPRANFEGALLQESSFAGADLSEANLQRADLTAAILVRTVMVGTKLSGADFSFADLTGAVFVPESIPDGRWIGSARGFETLVLGNNPALAIQLRDHFKQNGYREQERRITYAIRRIHRIDGLSDFAAYVLFEWTCKWGMEPLRPLFFLLILGVGCWIFYTATLLPRFTPATGIYKDWANDQQPPEFVTYTDFRAIAVGGYFSILSAFYIGWQELKLANWLERLNPQLCTFRAEGGVRTVSALQAIVSTYLLALWILTYFGRPFE